ncbi:MAG TPA: Ni/Fe hydrogenase subunit alpha [Thermodesulfobacteriota bacterium]|nr:Ni/Fe hydrogenase subunit alpha [Thermodesulfobacteriota bacterium]
MQKITIEPVTRIEGHAKVTIHLNGKGKVEKAFMHVNEWRGFEKFTEGRPFFEMPQITPRICGICPVSHHLSSAKACDRVVGVTPPRPAQLLRELMHMAQFIQSHSMHFFELAGPDLLLGFDADPAIRNVVGVVQANPEVAVKAVRLRGFGQDIIRRLGGKRIHPNHSIPGGVNAPLTLKDRDEILSQVDDMTDVVKTALTIGKGWYEKNMDLVNNFAVFSSGYMGLVDQQGGLQLYDGMLRLVDGSGKKLEEFDPENYLDYIGEHVEDWSYLKFPFYLKMGWPKGTYRVGPLGRLNVADKINTPLANEEFKNFKALGSGKPVEGTLWYHYARLIEDLYAIERAKEILLDPDVLSTDLATDYAALTGEGVGCIEAPRGTLFHHYKTDQNGMLTKVNLIVATGHNNWAMSNSVEMVAKAYVDGKKLTEGMLNRVEAAIRAYDPCLSCSTHAIGAMPMVVEMLEPDGTVVDRICRG